MFSGRICQAPANNFCCGIHSQCGSQFQRDCVNCLAPNIRSLIFITCLIVIATAHATFTVDYNYASSDQGSEPLIDVIAHVTFACADEIWMYDIFDMSTVSDIPERENI